MRVTWHPKSFLSLLQAGQRRDHPLHIPTDREVLKHLCWIIPEGVGEDMGFVIMTYGFKITIMVVDIIDFPL